MLFFHKTLPGEGKVCLQYLYNVNRISDLMLTGFYETVIFMSRSNPIQNRRQQLFMQHSNPKWRLSGCPAGLQVLCQRSPVQAN